MEKNIILKKGIVRRILSYLLALAMVLTTVNMPVLTMTVKADNTPSQPDSQYITIDQYLGQYLYYRNYKFADNGETDKLVHFELDSGNPIYTSVLKSDIEKITNLTINTKDDNIKVNVTNLNYFNDLSQFTNLQELTIEDLTMIKNISLPISLEKLTINNSTFYSESKDYIFDTIDLSNCTNLKEINFIGNKFSNNVDGPLVGKITLSNLNQLTKVTFDRSDIREITLSSGGSGNLDFSASDCKELLTLNLGGYTVSANQSLTDSTKLTSIIANISVSGTTNEFAISDLPYLTIICKKKM